jgi:hypothetical protein
VARRTLHPPILEVARSKSIERLLMHVFLEVIPFVVCSYLKGNFIPVTSELKDFPNLPGALT